jgi:hypothetical protein
LKSCGRFDSLMPADVDDVDALLAVRTDNALVVIASLQRRYATLRVRLTTIKVGFLEGQFPLLQIEKEINLFYMSARIRDLIQWLCDFRDAEVGSRKKNRPG